MGTYAEHGNGYRDVGPSNPKLAKKIIKIILNMINFNLPLNKLTIIKILLNYYTSQFIFNYYIMKEKKILSMHPHHLPLSFEL